MCCSKFPSGLNRLIAAALVDDKFCQLLLTRPEVAIEMMYNNEALNLTTEDKQLVLLVKASSLGEFAMKIYHQLG